MCGIVGYVGDQECGYILLDGLRRLEYRGYDSAGVALLKDGQLVCRRAEGKLKNLEASFFTEPVDGQIGIAHTRWATHGKPVHRNAHPHRAGDVVVVHNGIIENHVELKEALMTRGRTFLSETDTEIIAHLVDEALEKIQTPSPKAFCDAVRGVLAMLDGSYGVLVLSESYPDTIIAARHSSPMVLGRGDNETFAASDIPAILSHTRHFIFLEDGDVAILSKEQIEIFAADGERVERPLKFINWDPVSAEKQGYKHFMLKEIHEQATKVADTMRGRVSLERGEVDVGDLGLSDAFIADIDHIQIVACGTSYHAGLVARTMLEKLAKIRTSVDLGSEYRYNDPIVSSRSLTIAISQSGETADTLAALREARGKGARVISICNVMESTIARESDGVLYTHAGPEIGVASTKAFTTQLVALLLLSTSLGSRRGVFKRESCRKLLDEARHLPTMIDGLLADDQIFKDIARDFSHATSFLYLGRSVHFPIALEGALKLKEISYIHAEGYAAGEMKHGPIALIDDNLPVVVIAPLANTYDKVCSNLEEVKARGGRVICVVTKGDTRIRKYADYILEIPDVSELLQPILSIIPLQLMAYMIADFRGTDIDQPRNLAKSVTVE